jgi:hypothetical protein
MPRARQRPGFYLITKDMCTALQDTPICAELHTALSCGLGHPWRLAPRTVLRILGFTPAHYLGKLFSPTNIARASY